MIKQLEMPWQSRALVLLDIRSVSYPTAEAFEHAVRGAASVVRHLFRQGFSPTLWSGQARSTTISNSQAYDLGMEALATVQASPDLDFAAVMGRLRREGMAGGALVMVTGVLDSGGVSVFKTLGRDYYKTIVMTVAEQRERGTAPGAASRCRRRRIRPVVQMGAGVERSNGEDMVYRFSWLAGIAAVIFAFTGLSSLLRPTPDGTPWQYIVLASLVLGATITWTALTYRAHPVVVVVANLIALIIAIARISAPETTSYLLPTGETLSAVGSQLERAFSLIRTGIEPVQPIAGIVIVLAVVFWVTGILLAWGLMRGHPYVSLIPPLVLALQFATMDRDRTEWLRILVFLAIVAGSIVAVTIDERDQSAGRLAGRTRRSGLAGKLAPSAAGLLGVTLLASVVSTGYMSGLVPYDGVLPWRSATGLTSDFYGGVAYNPFIGIKQSLVSQSNTPVFLAHITGDVPGDQVYFRLVTMETYNGGQFFADEPTIVDLETRPWEEGGNTFAGPVNDVTTVIQIERLRMDWLPASYVPTTVSANPDILETMRVRQMDGSLRLEGDVTYEGMTYQVESSIPAPDIAVLEADEDGELSPAFAYAATEQDRPRPSRCPAPGGARGHRDLPRSSRRTSTPASDARPEGKPPTCRPTMRSALLSSPGSTPTPSPTPRISIPATAPPILLTGCSTRNRPTTTSATARTSQPPWPSWRAPSECPHGSCSASPPVNRPTKRMSTSSETATPMPGWNCGSRARDGSDFDPTPRGDGINPTAYGQAESALGFDVTTYLDVPDPEPIAGISNSRLPNALLGEDGPDPDFTGLGDTDLVRQWLRTPRLAEGRDPDHPAADPVDRRDSGGQVVPETAQDAASGER